MPRQVRIEFAGAFYHVMARGDRREPIFLDEGDRRMFLSALGKACERSGFRIHAWVLMANHYHLLVETPEANLSEGMGWLQNTYTRKFNVRHGLWGHLFGGRYKALVVEPGSGFHAVLNYIHLNPVRARLVSEPGDLRSHPWSSLHQYLMPPKSRPAWLETAMGFSMAGTEDTVRGRREFLEILERLVGHEMRSEAGVQFQDPRSGGIWEVGKAVKRGWVLGSDEFRDKLLSLIGSGKRGHKPENGYNGPEVREHGMRRAEALLRAGLDYYRLEPGGLRRLAKNDRRKAVLAAVIHGETTARLDWISENLVMGSRAGCCRIIRAANEKLAREVRAARRAMMSIINA